MKGMKHMDIQTVTTDELFIMNKVGTDFCTSSRIIADALEKQHKDVLRKIEELLTVHCKMKSDT